MEITRRGFVKLVTSSGIVLGISHLSTAAEPTFRARETLPGSAPWNPSAAGKGRVDGVAKVTGAKLYASDFRAALRSDSWSASPLVPKLRLALDQSAVTATPAQGLLPCSALSTLPLRLEPTPLETTRGRAT